MRTNKVERAPMDVGILILIVTLLMIGSGFSAVAEEPSATEEVVLLDVQNMTWNMCELTVRKSLTKLDGVSEAIVDRKAGTASVTYDPGKVEFDQMTEATTNAGFPSKVRESSGGE